MVPHRWQCDEMVRLAGYAAPPRIDLQVNPSRELPLLYTLVAANSSGKDQYLVSAFAVWFAVKGIKNRFIGTSSSFSQVKNQTEPGIRYIISKVNEKFGPIFHSVQFHHICTLTGSEILLFATDEPKNAEGYHPWPGGEMALYLGEAKSITEEIYSALTRCEGYSYWLEISSGGGKSGSFFNHAMSAVKYPAPLQLGKYFCRHISQFDCPHIPRGNIERLMAEMPQWWIDSSILGLFSSMDNSEIIPDHIIEANDAHFARLEKEGVETQIGDDIGIGLDTAGGIDENSLYVRFGNKIKHNHNFRQRDTDYTADIIDTQLLPWKAVPDYKFDTDDGGISQAITDQLVKRKWNPRRRHNQSPAYNKAKFLNLGIEMWWKVRMLIIRNEIPIPKDPILRRQLTTRRLDGQSLTEGKLRIEPKDEHRNRCKESPDRADAFVLCYWSYGSNYFADEPTPKKPRFASVQDFKEAYEWGEIDNPPPKHYGRIIQTVTGI